MSLIRRKIDVQMVLNGDTFSGGGNTITLTGLRCQASLLSYEGGIVPAVSQLQMRICGMRGDDMAKLSTLGFSSGTYVKNIITVTAGDDDSGMSQVFSGGITSARVRYNDQPDVSVEILAFAGYYEKLLSVQGRSTPGAVDVADALKSICNTVGFTLVNNGVTAKLNNHASSGTTMTQIADICHAAKVAWTISGTTIYIWPPGSTKDQTIIDMNPSTGMVGYPEYTGQGVDVTSLFNPAIEVGRRMKITTSVPGLTAASQQNYAAKAFPKTDRPAIPGDNGLYNIFSVRHELESETPGGKWFTQASTGFYQTVARAAP